MVLQLFRTTLNITSSILQLLSLDSIASREERSYHSKGGNSMTNNQIQYWSLQETKRHNQAGESENIRHNVAAETETGRHNLATEQVDISKLNETVRHNQATEQFNISSLQETKRHNVETERTANRSNEIRAEANAISKAYNQALTALKSAELNLNERRELQRIQESVRDFNEQVRQNDILAALKSADTINNSLSAFRGHTAASVAAATTAATATTQGLKALAGPVASTVTEVGSGITWIPDFLLKLNAIRPKSSGGMVSN